MLESVIVLLAIAGLCVFLYDIRRRFLQHQQAIQKEKDEISHLTHMTATMCTFADGKHTESLMGASEDAQLFFFRLFISGEIAARYTIDLSNIRQVDLLINGQREDFTYPTSHRGASMRATDISMQARQRIPATYYDEAKEIYLVLYYKSEGGEIKILRITVCKNPTAQLRKALPKILENAIWWQQYLTILITEREDALGTDIPDANVGF